VAYSFECLVLLTLNLIKLVQTNIFGHVIHILEHPILMVLYRQKKKKKKKKKKIKTKIKRTQRKKGGNGVAVRNSKHSNIKYNRSNMRFIWFFHLLRDLNFIKILLYLLKESNQ